MKAFLLFLLYCKIAKLWYLLFLTFCMQKLLFSAKNQSKILWKHLAERGNLYTSRFYYSKKHKIINISKNVHSRNQCLIAFSLHCYSKNSYKDNIKNGKKMKNEKFFLFFLVIYKICQIWIWFISHKLQVITKLHALNLADLCSEAISSAIVNRCS